MDILENMGERAKKAAFSIGIADTALKNRALAEISRALLENIRDILAQNSADVENAKSEGMNDIMLDRLRLDSERVRAMADGVAQVMELADPVGEVVWKNVRPNGLEVSQVRVPVGVVGMIYESRPNVTVDAAALCLKTGNAVILRGGREAIRSNSALCAVMRRALEAAGITADAVQLVEDTSRETAVRMMRLNRYIDVLIPRGGAGLIRTVVENATVPAIETGTGNCHVYVDETADIGMAVDIIVNAKCSRPSVCNAAESLLVHRGIAEAFLPAAAAALKQKGVELRVCPETARILREGVIPATEEDFCAEFLDYILSVKVVSSLCEAVSHINRCSTHHSDAIVTSEKAAADRFLKEIDSAAVYVNASTRFTDGFEFGFGAEIGISTQKLHARGPMGLVALTTVKYQVRGNGQIK